MQFLSSMRSLGPRYVALWVGQTVSQFGTYIALLSVPLLVLHIQAAAGSENTLDFAITYALETAPTLLVGLAGGVLLDRLHLRPVMVATDLLRASAFFYLAAQVGSYGVGTVFAMAFIVGSMTTLFDGALYAVIPALVPKHRLSDANAFVTVSIQANLALGPLVAGVMAAVFAGPAVGLFLNGVTFVISAWSLRYVGRVSHHRDPNQRAPYREEFRAGMLHIWNEPRLRISTIASSVPNFVLGFMEATFVVLAVVVFRTENETQIGILFFFMGLGGVIGALVAPRITRALGLGRSMVIGLGLSGITLLAVMFTEYGVVTMALLAAYLFGLSVINVPLATIRQIYAGEQMLGRVITAARAIGWATLPVGALVGGWLGNTESTYPWIARLFPLILIGCALWLFTTVIWHDTFGPEFRTGLHEAPKRSTSRAAENEIVAEVPDDEEAPSTDNLTKE